MIRLLRLMQLAWHLAEAEHRLDDYDREMKRLGVDTRDPEVERVLCALASRIVAARTAYLALRRGER